MGHNRKIVLGGVSLTKARLNRHSFKVGPEVMDEIEQLMISTGYLDNAPFKWIGLMLRYGLKNDEEPSYQRIDKKDGELPIAIELDTHELHKANRYELKRLVTLATLKALIHVGEKYELPTSEFVERKKQLLSEVD